MKYIPLIELPILIILVLIRSAILRRHGIKAIVFGATDKTDFFMIPVVLSFFYAILAPFFNWPFPAILTRLFTENNILIICSIVICTASLVWLAITLKIFGLSFRVGIDTQTKDKLITVGTFAISRNPIYLTFISFFTGIFIAYPNIVSLLFLLFITAAVHRQILREEKFLKGHYGEEYVEYCKKVRRYL
jgi:protein-S-isoprenylcysteine O-methyltransferase Ste14